MIVFLLFLILLAILGGPFLVGAFLWLSGALVSSIALIVVVLLCIWALGGGGLKMPSQRIKRP